MTCPQLWTKTQTSISRKICCLKSGFQILYVVEQFSSLFSKDKLKQGAHIHQTHDLPSPHMLWYSCRAVPNQQLLHVLCGTGTWRSHLCSKGSFYTGFPGHWPMAMPCCWAPVCAKPLPMAARPRDMAVCMHEVMARPWVGVCVPLALIYW